MNTDQFCRAKNVGLRLARRLPVMRLPDRPGSGWSRPKAEPASAKAMLLVCALTLLLMFNGAFLGVAAEPAWPGTTWLVRSPAEAGLRAGTLAALAELVGGRGCVVRHGYLVYGWGDQSLSRDVASAMKPVLSTLLFCAIRDGRLANPDQRVADFEPRLNSLNDGKDAAITWRHLASQTSGYGLIEAPGTAYSYNDYALALYYDTLMRRVFRASGTTVLQRELATPLQFQDDCTFEAFGPTDRPGRLAMSVRDFARFGLLILREGRWRDRQLLPRESVRQMLNSPVPPDLPRTSGREASMLPGQRSVGGTRNITPVGPGFYSFNWWLNRTNAAGQRLFVDAPAGAVVASGHGGVRCLWIVPGLDLIVSWNDSRIDDHDTSPGNPNSLCNRAARLMVEAVTATDAETVPH